MSEGKTIGVGDNLQEDVHVVENGGQSLILAKVLGNLGQRENKGVSWI